MTLESDVEAEIIETQWELKEKYRWTLFSFLPSPEYIAAIAVKQKGVQISYHDWDSY